MNRRSLFVTSGVAAAAVLTDVRMSSAQATPAAVDYVARTKAFYATVVNGRDFSQPGAPFAADYVSLIPGDIPGPDAAAQRLKSFLEGLDPYWTARPNWTIDETIAQDSRVAVRGHVAGTLVTPSNTPMLAFFGVLHFEGDLLSLNSLLFDRSAV